MDRPEVAKERPVVFTCTATCAEPIHTTPWLYNDHQGHSVTGGSQDLQQKVGELAQNAVNAHNRTNCQARPLVSVTAGGDRFDF
jgi:hypothetical protein